LVELSEVDGVGANGVPVKVGEANGAAPNIVIVWETVRSEGEAVPPVLFPLRVRVGIVPKYVLVTPPVLSPIVPVDVIVPPVIGPDVAIDVTPGAGYTDWVYAAICAKVARTLVLVCTIGSESVPVTDVAAGRLVIEILAI
jgi:hypothetical protein